MSLTRRSRAFARVVALGLLLALLPALIHPRAAPVAHAAPTGIKNCLAPDNGTTASIGDTITCTLKLTGTAADLPPTAIVTVAATGANYSFVTATCTSASAGAGCNLLGSVGATSFAVQCVTAACTDLTITETLIITAVTPATVTQQVNVSNPAASFSVTDPTFRIVPPGATLFAAPKVLGTGSCQSRANACLLDHALAIARDGDTVALLISDEYTVTQTIQVTRSVTIQPDGSGRVILRASPGITIFEITAPGGPAQHAAIRNLTLGGNFKEGSTEPAFRLLGDGYTEIANNIVGGLDLPINNGIVLAGSDHPSIHDNSFQGTTRFVFTELLVVGKTTTGFGVITTECLGVPGVLVSSTVTIKNNLFATAWLAGVWLCSDGGGKHDISGNVFRNYWRGIALKDVVNTHVGDNNLLGGRSDGIILYGAALRNRIEKNHVESHVATDAAGIRVGWVADPILPIDNTVENNELFRDTIGIHVFGAVATKIRTNEIKIAGARTAILLTPATQLGDPATQPRDTEITGNTIIFAGPCGPVIGCALRLLGVTVPVNATDNEWGGLRRVGDVERVIWHQNDDPLLGLVTYVPFRNPVAELSPTPTLPATATSSPAATPTPTATATATATSTTTAPITSVALTSGCSRLAWPGADGMSVVDASLGLTPAPAQRTATIWRQDADGWRAWNPAQGTPSQVFRLRRGDALLVCVSQIATWLIPTEIGGV